MIIIKEALDEKKILQKQRPCLPGIKGEFYMARRSADWNEGLAQDLRKPEFAQEFVFACLESGVSLQQALGKIIRAYGVQEFAKRAKLPPSNVLRAIHPKRNITLQTLDKLLRPLQLRLSVEANRKKKAA